MTPAQVLARFPPLTPEQAAEVEALRVQRADVNQRLDSLRQQIARLKRLEEPLVLEERALQGRIVDADLATRARAHVAAAIEKGSYLDHNGRLCTLIIRERDGVPDHIVGTGVRRRKWYTGTMRAAGPGRWIDGRGDVWVEVSE